MSKKSHNDGMDVGARTARLHPATPHRIPYLKHTVMCDCGGVPQPSSASEVSKAKKAAKRAAAKLDEERRLDNEAFIEASMP